MASSPYGAQWSTRTRAGLSPLRSALCPQRGSSSRLGTVLRRSFLRAQRAPVSPSGPIIHVRGEARCILMFGSTRTCTTVGITLPIRQRKPGQIDFRRRWLGIAWNRWRRRRWLRRDRWCRDARHWSDCRAACEQHCADRDDDENQRHAPQCGEDCCGMHHHRRFIRHRGE